MTDARETGDHAPARLPGWLPNAITWLRIVLIPVFLLLATAESRSRVACMVTLGALGFSDVADGWLARRYGLGTAFGATLDAVADKLAQVALITLFAFDDSTFFWTIPMWFFAVVVARDVVLGVGWLLIRAKRGTVVVEHEQHGKLASFLTFLMLFWITAGLPDIGGMWVVIALTILIVASTVRYFQAGWRQFVGELSPRP